MAHRVARWSLVTVTVFLVGPAAVAQTDNPASGSRPFPNRPFQGQPVQWSAAAKFRMDCAQDVKRLCHGVQPGAGRLIQCLLSNRGQLSPACMSRVAAARPAPGVAHLHIEVLIWRRKDGSAAIRRPAHRPGCDAERHARLLRSGCAKALRWGLQGKRRRHKMPGLSPHGTVANMRCVFQGNAGAACRAKECAKQ